VNKANCISLLQWTSKADWESNKQEIERLMEKLPDTRPQLVIFPEMFARFGAGEQRQGKFAETAGDGDIQSFIAALAARHKVWILAGTLPIDEGERYAAASLLYDEQGEQVARYDKIHLFDALVDDGTKRYQESKFTQPGKQIVVIDTPWGKLGLSVCYDLRFPELFRALRNAGAELIALPSAFTKVTGEAHWRTLLAARAIEQQVFMLAPNQTGTHADGRETWGHSMVIDPWGREVGALGAEPGVLTVYIDHEAITQVRDKMPIAAHNQFEVKFIEHATTSE